MTTPAVPPDDQPWRIGTSWGIHVYQGEKGSPGERPVATFHDPADAQRAVDAVNGAERGGEELREVIAEAARDLLSSVDEWPTGLELADAVLPVVTAWAERQARERAADALLWAAWIVAHSPGIQHQAKAVSEIRARAGATTADDRPGT